MQAVHTKILGPTNTRGTRIVATCAAKRTVVAYDHELDRDANHARAATALAVSLGWLTTDTVLVSGTLADGTDCHVLADTSLRGRGWSRVATPDTYGLVNVEHVR